jgi:hypothetical protein
MTRRSSSGGAPEDQRLQNSGKIQTALLLKGIIAPVLTGADR